MTLAGWAVVPLTPEHAGIIATWSYAAPLDRYSSGDPGSLLRPASLALLDGDGELAAFRTFGADGQVPGFPYDGSAVDTGGGLRPDLVGRGLGLAVLLRGIEEGRRLLGDVAFRVTIWGGNAAALRTVARAGFEEAARFDAPSGDRFVVLVQRPSAVG